MKERTSNIWLGIFGGLVVLIILVTTIVIIFQLVRKYL